MKLEYDGNGNTTKSLLYSGPTLNANATYGSMEFDTNWNCTKATTQTIGADLIWGTADDVLVGTEELTYDGRIFVKGVNKNAAGTITRETVHEKQANGRYLGKTSSAAGADGIWGNADDIYDTHYSYNTYDTNQNLIKMEYKQCGPDGIIGTADDTTDSISGYEYEAF